MKDPLEHEGLRQLIDDAGYAVTEIADARIVANAGGEIRLSVRDRDRWLLTEAQRAEDERPVMSSRDASDVAAYLAVSMGMEARTRHHQRWLALPRKDDQVADGFTVTSPAAGWLVLEAANEKSPPAWFATSPENAHVAYSCYCAAPIDTIVASMNSADAAPLFTPFLTELVF